MTNEQIFNRLDDECRYPYLSPAELLERLSEKAILYLPLGSLEWHNEHLPLGTDTFHAIEMSRRMAGRIGGVALPAFWFNTGGCHAHASTYHMPEKGYPAALENICLGLAPIPARLLVLVNGHGGIFQKTVPRMVAELLNAGDFPMRVIPADPFDLGASSPCRLDHADIGETSAAMELIPQLVRMDRDVTPDVRSGNMPFSKGQPSREGGVQMWEAFIKDAEELITREYAGLQ